MATVMKKDKCDLVERRRHWLLNNSKLAPMTAKEFANVTGIDYGTAVRYFQRPIIPRKLYRDQVLKAFPDFPI